jgi:phosphatidylserine/phosphatidylglycerophosphate/cardiolipin synthase-like enzyme
MLYVEPYAGVAPIIRVIDSARHSIDLGVYYLSSGKMLDALRSAHARGVDVRIILDQRPYHMKPAMISREWQKARATGASVQWAPIRFEMSRSAHHYAFYHAKYLCTQSTCEIGSANFDWSAFHRNREYLDITSNPQIVRAARTAFSADWHHQQAGNMPHQILVLSPGGEAGVAAVIKQPGPVYIESEECGNDRQILRVIANKGGQAWMILPSSISGADKRNVAWLEKRGVHVRLLPKKPYFLHAKAISGSQYGFVGSENFSSSSLVNREMGVILTGSDVAVLKTQFHKDWNAAAPFQAGSSQGGGKYAGRSHWHHWKHHWHGSGYASGGHSSWGH